MIADLTAFSPEEILKTGTYSDPVSYPKGFFTVLVAGKIIMRGDRLNGERPGKALRRNQCFQIEGKGTGEQEGCLTV